MNRGIESARTEITFAKLIEDALDVISPRRVWIFLRHVSRGKTFTLVRKSRRGEFDLAISARRGSHLDMLVDRERQDEALVVIGVVPEQFKSARRPDHVRGVVSKLFPKEFYDWFMPHRNKFPV